MDTFQKHGLKLKSRKIKETGHFDYAEFSTVSVTALESSQDVVRSTDIANTGLPSAPVIIKNATDCFTD